MMDYTPDGIDELELSALLELSTIISKDICSWIALEKKVSCEITPPYMTSRLDIKSDENIVLDTGIGIIEADIVVEYSYPQAVNY